MGEEPGEVVLVVNFGGQYAHMISRRVRELGAYAEVVPHTRIDEYLRERGTVKAVVLSGGPSRVTNVSSYSGSYSRLLNLGVPVLGICFGHQLMAHLLGGEVRSGKGEFGRTEVTIVREDPIFEGWGRRETVWMSHKDSVFKLPSNAVELALSEGGGIAAFKVKGRPVYGVQFHPEVRHTPKGMKLIENFLTIAGVKRSWNPGDLAERLVKEIAESVGGEAKVLVAVSGGIDSTVAAVLTKKAVGDRLVAVLVDHGLFREGEVEEVMKNLSKAGIDVKLVDGRDRFLSRLEGTRDCEERRKIIGEEFAKIFMEIAESDPKIRYFVQGTTYPDVVESGCEESSDKIKSHHNVAGLPSWFNLKVIEPLKYLYKDEVRKLGKALGIPKEVITRHPFPGPGLAVRIIGEFTLEKLEIVRKASKILEDELRRAGVYEELWQAFAVVGDDTWVGVKGDAREVGYIVTLRVVSSDDAMTADWVRLPHDLLDRIARRITAELRGVTAVTYVITSKPPSTIEPC